MSFFAYAVHLANAEEGGFVVTCRDLPELITQGNTLEDALEQACDAMDEAFAVRMDDGLVLPPPSEPLEGEYRVSPPAETMVKAALYQAMREADVGQTELARRLGVNEKEVRRMLDPHHATKLPRMAAAVQALGKRLVISVEAA